MKEKIMQQLRELETKHDITIILAVDSGSYVYGYASPESDHDVRFIYVGSLSFYFSITAMPDNIEIKDDGCGMEFVGYDLKKALGLILKGNALMAEWINSDICYINRNATKERLKHFSEACFSLKGSLNHYLGLSSRHNERYLKKELTLKRMIYYIRGLMACVWIEKNREYPPTDIFMLTETTIDNPEVKTLVTNMLNLKRQGRQHDKAPVSQRIYDYFSQISLRMEEVVKTAPKEETSRMEDEMVNYFIETVKGVRGDC